MTKLFHIIFVVGFVIVANIPNAHACKDGKMCDGKVCHGKACPQKKRSADFSCQESNESNCKRGQPSQSSSSNSSSSSSASSSLSITHVNSYHLNTNPCHTQNPPMDLSAVLATFDDKLLTAYLEALRKRRDEAEAKGDFKIAIEHGENIVSSSDFYFSIGEVFLENKGNFLDEIALLNAYEKQLKVYGSTEENREKNKEEENKENLEQIQEIQDKMSMLRARIKLLYPIQALRNTIEACFQNGSSDLGLELSKGITQHPEAETHDIRKASSRCFIFEQYKEAVLLAEKVLARRDPRYTLTHIDRFHEDLRDVIKAHNYAGDFEKKTNGDVEKAISHYTKALIWSGDLSSHLLEHQVTLNDKRMAAYAHLNIGKDENNAKAFALLNEVVKDPKKTTDPKTIEQDKKYLEIARSRLQPSRPQNSSSSSKSSGSSTSADRAE